LNKDSDKNEDLETVLVMQGGGSLGAYGCGVYKTLAKHNIDFDIISGTSIGAINASIIVGSKSGEPATALEDFWLDLSEKFTLSLPESLRPYFSSTYSLFFGNPKAFKPAWFPPYSPFSYFNSPYLYGIAPLKNTLENYIDFTKLNSNKSSRLIITSTDIQNGEAVVFDNRQKPIDTDHIVACAGFPFYGIEWTFKDGRYLWDGALQSNTPLREVIDASPKNDKKVYMINLFPRNHCDLPSNMFESIHRARDISHTDKTDHNVRMSHVISKYLLMLKEMHEIIGSVEEHLDSERKARLMKVERLYHKFALDHGAMIKEIVRIERSEETHFLFEDADFSVNTIKKLISQGERDAEKAISKSKMKH